MIVINPWLKLMRPKQWFKSFYIIFGSLPAIFLMPMKPDVIILFLSLGILNMILIQGVMYITNDIADLKADRLHPKKKNRPIASGKISVREALIFSLFLFSLALIIAFMLDFRIVIIDLALVLNNLLYSFKPIKFKDIKYVDILSASINFPLRVMVGWFLFEPYNQARLTFSYNFISTESISNSIQSIIFNSHPRIIELFLKFSTVTLSFVSIMLLTYFFAVFLLSLKRLAEKLNIKNAEKIRKSLEYYRPVELKLIAIFSAMIVLISFVLLSWSLKPILVVLSPFALLMMIWYYKLTFLKNSIVTAPEDIFTKMSKFVIVAIAICLLALIILFL